MEKPSATDQKKGFFEGFVFGRVNSKNEEPEDPNTFIVDKTFAPLSLGWDRNLFYRAKGMKMNISFDGIQLRNEYVLERDVNHTNKEFIHNAMCRRKDSTQDHSFIEWEQFFIVLYALAVKPELGKVHLNYELSEEKTYLFYVIEHTEKPASKDEEVNFYSVELMPLKKGGWGFYVWEYIQSKTTMRCYPAGTVFLSLVGENDKK